MGSGTSVKRRSGIRRMFVWGFLGVLATTAISSLIAVGFVLFLLGQATRNTPQIDQPAKSLESYANRNTVTLFSGDSSARSDLDTRADKVEGLDYVLLNARGEPLAGDPSSFGSLPSLEQIAGNLNSSRATQDGRHIEDTVPLVGDGRIQGYLLLRYSSITNPALDTAENVKLGALLVLAALLPVILLSASTFFFARRASRRLGKPIGELREAVDKIRGQDLDFDIDYDEPDELGDLSRAFRNLRDELRGSLEREWRQRQELEETVASLSHDLRNPATVIQGHVESLQRTAEDRRAERLERYLPVLDAASRRMSRLLDTILVAANLHSQATLGRPQAVHISEELTRKLKTFELLAKEREVELSQSTHLQASASSEEPVDLDLEVFERVLDNLFENALRFTPAGGEIALEVVRDEHDIRVSVRDSGPGVPPEELERVFDKGYQSEKGDTRSEGSSGLGLYISRKLLEQQGGQISLGNRSEGGCEVRFTLPIAPYQPSTANSVDA